jgi:hypothetical protein
VIPSFGGMGVSDDWSSRVEQLHSPRWVSVFAVDPGVDSGWAWLVYEVSRLDSDGALGAVRVGSGLNDPLFRFGEISCVDEDASTWTLADWIGASSDKARRFIGGGDVRTVVVVESFSLRERTASNDLLSPVRLSAKLGLLVWLINQEEPGVVEWFWQSPSDAKSVCTDERMRRWGLWQAGKPHATDAIRHLILWLRKEIADEH